MSILAVILFAAILHASWNAFIKNKGNGFAKMVTLASIISLMMVPFLFYVGLPSSTAAIYLFFGVIAHTMYMHSLTRAYAIEDFSVAYPFARGLAPLLTILILIFILNKGYDNFALVEIKIENIEWLYLHRHGHRRALFKRNNEELTKEWLTP